jgi:hypothetical protein
MALIIKKGHEIIDELIMHPALTRHFHIFIKAATKSFAYFSMVHIFHLIKKNHL